MTVIYCCLWIYLVLYLICMESPWDQFLCSVLTGVKFIQVDMLLNSVTLSD